MTGHSRHTANAFASTFYFFADTKINAKKIKRACKQTHEGQCKLDTKDLRPKRATTHNTGVAKVAVPCSADTFTHLLIVLNGIRNSLRLIVVNQTLVFQIKFCGKSPALRVAAKR